MDVRPADRLRWIIACAAGELVGIALAALWFVTMDRVAPEPPTLAARIAMLAAKALSGLPEGIVLGSLQAWALRRRYPRLPMRDWIVATVLLAFAGWAVGASFSVFASPAPAGPVVTEPPIAAVVAMAAAFGLAVGALFGAVQAWVLRRAAQDAGWWIPFNALGWAAALPAIYLAASIDLGSGAGGAGFAGIAGGCAAGLLLGAVTSLAFDRMPPRHP